MSGDPSLLKNFIEKFMRTVRFGNDQFAAIIGYGDYVHGNITICHVYYVEGLEHNLFSEGQFCDDDLEVDFRSKTCYVRNLEGDDLLTGTRESNLYTISISDMAASSPVFLMSKATLTKSWLWHRRLSHLNFGTINDLTKQDLVDGLIKFKYDKDHLCSALPGGEGGGGGVGVLLGSPAKNKDVTRREKEDGIICRACGREKAGSNARYAGAVAREHPGRGAQRGTEIMVERRGRNGKGLLGWEDEKPGTGRGAKKNIA
ncbi:integrase, catalytic region, zinc finger, CCHC-type containing protein [Tanacetum coccineum]